ncbi:bifunctional YncE family protein/alkaline phosphatase family protein [Zavarzinella formosa]|uniref:bifunctional YncE family protein/alkaline phosphatase family protein n=1 Tax=Zavarzinella formosa TaxID=360055 RepID=UPI000304783D|nr:alkaline phosphatase family protein [Zavarzinella formosa]
MRSQSLTALAVCLLGTLVLFASIDQKPKGDEPPPPMPRKAEAPAPRVLPGLQADGTVQLPNQWKLRPVGKQIEVGNFPVNQALHPSGQYLAVLHAGMQEHEVMIIDLNKAKQRIISRVTVDQAFYGLCFSPDGRRLYASGGEFEVVHEFEFARGLLSNPKTINLAGSGERLVVGGLTMDAAGRELFACCTWGDIVVRVPAENPENKTAISLGLTPPAKKDSKPKGDPPSPPDGRKEPKDGEDNPPPKKDLDEKGTHPYAAVVHPEGKFLFVSLWGESAVAVVDLEKNEVVKRLPTALHPTEMAADAKNRALYVACANSTQVSVLHLDTFEPLQTINCALYPAAPSGNTPNSLTLIPEGPMLLVANADANNLSVFNVAEPKTAKPLGFIPTGWYPTSVRYNNADKKIYVANGKGLVSKSNRGGPNPLMPTRNLYEYIGNLLKGTVGIIDLPTPDQMTAYSKTAYACSPLHKDSLPNIEGVPEDNPIPKKVGDKSPIKHVIYIVKENRTYDQVFGDIPQGNGEAGLCLFPEAITPNHHKIVKQFVLLDNIYVDGEVSADGHEWSMGAYATDFVEKAWPMNYRGSPRQRFTYPAEGSFDYIARPAGGYIWDRAAEAGVTYRSYGEWIENGYKKKDGTFGDGKAKVKALEGHFDPKYRGYDLGYLDVKRAERFIGEVKRFEKEGGFPQLTILRLPNDHTAGTKVGSPTPTAMVADNDLALGMVVEAVSESKFWKDTAIFVIEDDAQNGPDHVDAHRVVSLVISPYTKKKYVDSTMYSTSSILRTIELILGLKPMSQFDAAARPMYHSFTGTPDFSTYKHEIPKTDLKAINVAGAWGADWSGKANLAKEDQADDLQFNEVIWKSVKGPASRMPPPVRAAFFLPLPKKEKDDDDDDDDD